VSAFLTVFKKKGPSAITGKGKRSAATRRCKGGNREICTGMWRETTVTPWGETSKGSEGAADGAIPITARSRGEQFLLEFIPRGDAEAERSWEGRKLGGGGEV